MCNIHFPSFYFSGRIMKVVTKEADGMSIHCEPNVFTELFTWRKQQRYSEVIIFYRQKIIVSNFGVILCSNSISVTPTSLPMSDLRPTVLPISVEQDLSLSPIASNCLVKGRERKWKCPQCPLILRSERSLVEHLVSHNSNCSLLIAKCLIFLN